MKYSLEIGNHSDVGKIRELNEDYYGSFHGKFGDLLIVCDGMGGHQGGEIASRLSVEAVKKHFESLVEDFDPAGELKNAINEANKTLIDTSGKEASLTGMGSTVVITFVKDDFAYTANLGDSRIYFIRDGSIKQITKDHSLVQQMVDSNMITTEEAKTHPKKNVITKSLGIDKITEPDISDPFKLKENDTFILCSDGLTSLVNDDEILEIVARNNPQDAAKELVDQANRRGGSDNITVQVARVITAKGEKYRISKKSAGKISLFLILILLTVLAVIFITEHFSPVSENVELNEDSLNTSKNPDREGINNSKEENVNRDTLSGSE